MNLELVDPASIEIVDDEQFLNNYFDWCNESHSGEITLMTFGATIRMFRLTRTVNQQINYFEPNTWKEEVLNYRQKFKPTTKEYQIVNSLLEL